MNNDKEIKRVALYSRVSTIDQNSENQKEALVSRANREGWEFVYFEETESTRKTRPIKYKLYSAPFWEEIGFRGL
jgi:DNA invertase Pin-like site-specific DNA recombinase